MVVVQVLFLFCGALSIYFLSIDTVGMVKNPSINTMKDIVFSLVVLAFSMVVTGFLQLNTEVTGML
jgi:hypothetical protein